MVSSGLDGAVVELQAVDFSKKGKRTRTENVAVHFRAAFAMHRG